MDRSVDAVFGVALVTHPMLHLSRSIWKNQYFFITFLGGIALLALGISALVFFFAHHFLVQFRVPCDPSSTYCLLEKCAEESVCRVTEDAFFSYAQAPASVVSRCDSTESCFDQCLASDGECQILVCDPAEANEDTECLSPKAATVRLTDTSPVTEQTPPSESIDPQALPTE